MHATLHDNPVVHTHVGPNSVCRSTDAPHKLRFASNSICYKLLLPQREKKRTCVRTKSPGITHQQRKCRTTLQLDEPKINCPLCSVGVAVQRKEQCPEAADMNRKAHTSKLRKTTGAPATFAAGSVPTEQGADAGRTRRASARVGARGSKEPTV